MPATKEEQIPKQQQIYAKEGATHKMGMKKQDVKEHTAVNATLSSIVRDSSEQKASRSGKVKVVMPTVLPLGHLAASFGYY